MTKTFTINTGAAIAALLLTASAHAQVPRTITVQAAGLQCSTQAGTGTFSVSTWSVGASNTAQSTGASGAEARAGRATLGPVNLVKGFDECSPALFGALATGTRIQSVTLTDRDPNVSTRPAVTIQLQDVLISQFVVSDSGAGPTEAVSLTYGRITITNTTNGSKFCWDTGASNKC